MSDSPAIATRDILTNPVKRRFAVVDTPGWGGVRIRSLTELERSQFESVPLGKDGALDPRKLVDQKCRLIVLCVVDENGDQILTNKDIEALRQQDSLTTNALVDGIKKHCGFTEADFQELIKN